MQGPLDVLTAEHFEVGHQEVSSLDEAGLVKRSQFGIVEKVYLRQLKRERGTASETRRRASRGGTAAGLPAPERQGPTHSHSRGGYQPWGETRGGWLKEVKWRLKSGDQSYYSELLRKHSWGLNPVFWLSSFRKVSVTVSFSCYKHVKEVCQKNLWERGRSNRPQ